MASEPLFLNNCINGLKGETVCGDKKNEVGSSLEVTDKVEWHHGSFIVFFNVIFDEVSNGRSQFWTQHLHQATDKGRSETVVGNANRHLTQADLRNKCMEMGKTGLNKCKNWLKNIKKNEEMVFSPFRLGSMA